MNIFVDTSYFIARTNRSDQWHARAIQAVRPGLRFFTSSLVLNETITLLQARGQLSFALEFLQQLRRDVHTRIIYAEQEIQDGGWEEYVEYSGSGANAVDCVSFAIMRRHAIRKAFTFDQHFSTAGFSTLVDD